MPDLHHEQLAAASGYSLVAGIDEAGRGPLAGPVVAAAVILPPGFSHPDINDSKKLSEKKREDLYEEILAIPGLLYGVASVEPNEIDRLNILRATHLAMAQATRALPQLPAYCLIDGLPVPNFFLPHEGLVKGDSRTLSIATASILAKVTRDRTMRALALCYPEYGFEKHKGYGTKAHLAALRLHGPAPPHRRSFQPIAQLSLPLD